MDARMMIRFGAQAFAVGGMVKAMRQARAEDDKLKMVDAVVQGLAIATAVAMIVREVKHRRDEQDQILPGNR